MSTKQREMWLRPVTKESANTCLADRVKAARARLGFTQETIGKKLGVSRVVVANWESGKASPEADRAVKLASLLNEDAATCLLLADLQRSAASDMPDSELLKVVNGLLLASGRLGSKQSERGGPQTHLSLVDFPEAFSPMVVVVGDKREVEPQNAGDLFVFSASPTDDRWLLTLGLPPETEKISDKVLMTAHSDPEWLAELGKKNILCIGSPASNLFSREYNEQFLFRFAVSREAKRLWEKKRDMMYKLEKPVDLTEFYLANRDDLKQIMRLFKPPGFIDFNYRHLRLGIDVGQDMDFAVISIGRNPFSAPGDHLFAILVAGIHHPGTANAVRFLADPSNFVEHPFGGILEVQVPSKEFRREDVKWHEKIGKCQINWHCAGSGDARLTYNPADLLAKLREWLGRIDNIATDVTITRDEIESHIDLIEQLAAAKQGNITPAPNVNSQ
jgi:transcriptional regulator with XRE-family HTH domain